MSGLSKDFRLRSKPMPKKKPWYHEGLCFECTGCGDCCTGDPGYVWVNRDEIKALAKHVGMSIADFENLCLVKIGNRWSLKELPGGDCVFFDRIQKRCKVYELRPHPVPHLALLEVQPEDAGGLGRDVQGLPRLWAKSVVYGEEIEERAGQVRV